jgi:hypothetical protein
MDMTTYKTIYKIEKGWSDRDARPIWRLYSARQYPNGDLYTSYDMGNYNHQNGWYFIGGGTKQWAERQAEHYAVPITEEKI